MPVLIHAHTLERLAPTVRIYNHSIYSIPIQTPFNLIWTDSLTLKLAEGILPVDYYNLLPRATK